MYEKTKTTSKLETDALSMFQLIIVLAYKTGNIFRRNKFNKVFLFI